nr:hypothetical protein [Tanacetum cinerariifolium]
VAVAGVGVPVLAGPTPTPVLETRTVDVGVPSGECGGELRLPGEDASFASIAAENQISADTPKSPDCTTTMHEIDRNLLCTTPGTLSAI